MKIYLLCLFATLSAINNAQAKTYTSSNTATELIELYTSEGCSSCPAADRWLSQLTANKQLFKHFIPLAFHVDYWNQLGWKDRFSSEQHSQRQYQHHEAGRISQVYTPAIIVNNQEWRGWRFSKFLNWPDEQKKIGILKVQTLPEQHSLEISFSPASNKVHKQYQIHSAILGMGLSTAIKRGENSGRLLKHDFVVLTHTSHLANVSHQHMQTWQIAMPDIPAQGQQRNVLVVWLSPVNSEHVIQAVGGYL